MAEYVMVSSTAIAAVAYDEATWALNVRLHSGAEYQYLSVPPMFTKGFFRQVRSVHTTTRRLRKRVINTFRSHRKLRRYMF